MITKAGYKIKVAFISHFFGIGGVPKTFLTIAENLIKDNYSFHFISLGNDIFLDRFRACGQCFHTVNLNEALGYLVDNSFDIAQVINCDEGSYLAHIAGIKTIVERQDGMTSAFAFDKTPVDCVISSTDTVFGKSKLEYPHKTVKLIYNGVDTSIFSPKTNNGFVRNKFNINENETIIGYCGRISWEKCIDNLIGIFFNLSLKTPNLKLVLIGNHHNDGYMEYIANMVIEKKLSDKVIFIGAVENPEEILPAFDIGVLTSGAYINDEGKHIVTKEGIPNSILEMMSCGVPVVCFDSGDVSSVVKDSVNGFVIPLGDNSMFEGKLQSLIDDPVLRKEMGAKGRSYIQMNFSIESMSSNYKSLYQSLALTANDDNKRFNRNGIENHFLSKPFYLESCRKKGARILVIRSAGEKMMDFVIDSLKKQLNSPEISILCNKRNYEQAAKYGLINKIFVYDKSSVFNPSLMNDILENINKSEFDYVFILYNDLLGKNCSNINDVAGMIKSGTKIVFNNLYSWFIWQS